MKSLNITLWAFCLCLVFACKKAPKGEEAKVGEAENVEMVTGASTLALDATNSMIMWTGSKIAGEHSGTIKMNKGEVELKNNEVVGGRFAIDMKSITNTDMEGDQKANLEGHLMSEDFFDVAKFPRGEFEITKLTKLINDDSASHLVYGNLTLKGVTKSVGFKASINVSDNGVSVKTPSFTIDRTDFGIKYGSSKFFDDLKDKAISDKIGLTIQLRAS